MIAAATISFSDMKYLLGFTVWCFNPIMRDASAPPKVQMRPYAKVNNPGVILLEVLLFYSPSPGYPWGIHAVPITWDSMCISTCFLSRILSQWEFCPDVNQTFTSVRSGISSFLLCQLCYLGFHYRKGTMFWDKQLHSLSPYIWVCQGQFANPHVSNSPKYVWILGYTEAGSLRIYWTGGKLYRLLLSYVPMHQQGC